MRWHPLSKEKRKGSKKKKKGWRLPILAPQKKSGKMVFTSLVSREYSSRRLSFRPTLKISKQDSFMLNLGTFQRALLCRALEQWVSL